MRADRKTIRTFFIPVFLTPLVILLGADGGTIPGKPPAYNDVELILEDNCVMCHAGPRAAKGLRLDSYENVLKGSERGPVIVPGSPEESELAKRLRGTSTPRMPLSGPPWLDDEDIRVIEEWIKGGATGPGKSETLREAQDESGMSPPRSGMTYMDVAPIFKMNCVKCHNHAGLMGPPPEGLVLATYREMMNGTERAYVVPGNPDASELVRKIRGQSFPRMPMDGPPYLSDKDIEVIARWVASGAPDEAGLAASMPVGRKVRLRGRLSGPSSLDGLMLGTEALSGRRKNAPVGSYIEVRGRITAEGTISVDEIRER